MVTSRTALRGLLSVLVLLGGLVTAQAQGTGKVYYTDCNSTSFPTPFYEYDVATDQWFKRAQIPAKNTTQLCADAKGNVYALPEEGRILQYDAGQDKWVQVMPGPKASVGRNAISMFETDRGEFFWAKDGQTTLYYTSGGTWTSVTTPRTISCASDVDRNTGYIYIRTYGELGYFVFDPATATFPIICDDTTPVGENARAGVLFNGEFFTREWSGNYIGHDGSCQIRDTGTAPNSDHSSSAVDSGGRVYSNGYTLANVFEVYDITSNTLTSLAAAPSLSGNGHSTLVVSEAGAAWSNYGQGFPGTQGVPAFVASNPPVLGQPITLTADNSDGSQRIGGFLVVGSSKVQVPGNWGGDLLAAPDLLFQAVSIPVSGLVLAGTLPNDPTLDGVPVYLQVIEFDSGAALGISNTAGLELLLGL